MISLALSIARLDFAASQELGGPAETRAWGRLMGLTLVQRGLGALALTREQAMAVYASEPERCSNCGEEWPCSHWANKRAGASK